MKPLFDLAAELEELKDCESCFQRGETLFEREHERYLWLSNRLQKEGYRPEQIAEFKKHYRSQLAGIREREKRAIEEERIAARILTELMSGEVIDKQAQPERREERQTREKEKTR